MICRNHVDVSEGVRRCSRCGSPFCSNCLVNIGDRPYCAGCKTEHLLDARSGVDYSTMRFSGFWQRLGAYLIDYMIQLAASYAILIPAGILVAMNSNTNSGEFNYLLLAAYPFLFAIVIGYEALMLQKKNGQTLGKMALRIRVVRPDGSPITKGQAWGRAVMRLVLGCLIIVDYIPVFFTQEKTTLHDMIVGTRVVDIY